MAGDADGGAVTIPVEAAYPPDAARGTGDLGGQFVKQGQSQPAAKPQPRVAPKARRKVQQERPTQKRPAPKAAPAAPAPGPPKSAHLNLKRGGKNDAAEVRNLQALLSSLRVAGVATDGQYGPATEAAVRAAQSKLGMKPTGRASSALIHRLADAHSLSPCVGKKVAAAADSGEDEDEQDAERVTASVAAGLDLTLWSDSTIWVGDALELDLDDASLVVAGVRLLASERQPGSYEVSDWLTLQVDDDGSTSLVADEDDEAIALRLADLNEFADRLAAMFEPAPVTAAAGADVTPGHDQLHHYWTRGEGLARWSGSPTPWTTLLANLVEEVKGEPLEVLKRWASAWFKEVKGYSSGSDLNRVAHGHPPRGNNIGPG